MPLYRMKGRPEDETYLLDDNPADPRYELVVDKAPVTPVEPAAPATKE